MYKRVQYQTITKRLKEPRHFLQVVLGPRQVGKTAGRQQRGAAGSLTGGGQRA